MTGDDAIYGFDIGNLAVYEPDWHDVMTYCDNLWVSDFTYHGLMDYIQDWWTPRNLLAMTDRSLLDQTDRLLVMGSLDPTTGQIDLQPLYVMPDAGDLQPRVPGDYVIVLRGAGGVQLARYPFTPDQSAVGPGPGLRAEGALLISELVPFVEGTSRVEIEGPGGGVLTSVSAGAATPSVTVIAPNGGEFLDGDPISVSWTASDADGDSLTFNVQYSNDNGENWEMLVQNVNGTSVDIPASVVASGPHSRFRVWVSDGIHTSSDDSDAPFAVPNRTPTVEIASPVGGETLATDQTLNLQASAYDVDTGSMEAEQLEWHSSINGLLGTGAQRTVTGLTAGMHTLTFQADDGWGGVATDTVRVTVVSHPDALPPVPDALSVGPSGIIFDPASGDTSARLSIDNQNARGSIAWHGEVSQSWVQLSAVSGTTPSDVTVTFNDTGLYPGLHTATITLSSPDVPGNTVVVPVHVTIDDERQTVHLPVILREWTGGLGPGPSPTPPVEDVLVPVGATWKYLDDGSNQGTAWREPGFDDSGWASGPAQLGYGDGDEATEVSYGPNSEDKYITTYFRHTFQVDDASAIGGLRLRLLRDDGALVYLNGTRVRRSNMPGGALDYQTLASTCVSGSDEGTFWEVDIGAEHLVSGSNVLAVEVHQCGPTSSDISFDLELSHSAADALDASLHAEEACVPRGSPVRLTTQWYADTAALAQDYLDALDLTVLVDGEALPDVPDHWGTVEALADIDDDGDMDYVTRWAYPIGILGGGAHTVDAQFSLAYTITDGFDSDDDGVPDEFSGSWDSALILQVGGCVVGLGDQEACVPSGSPVRLTTQWYAATEALAQDYLEALDLTIEVDGEPLSDVPDHWSAAEPCGDFDEDGETDYVTRWAYPVKDLDDGEHTVDAHFSLAYPITDGFDSDGDGVLDEFSGSWDYTLALRVGGCVLFDEAHEEANTLSWERARIIEPAHPDWVYFGALADALDDEFMLLRNPDEPLTPELLAGYDALMLSVPQEALTPEELAAVEAFLENGGGVLALSNWAAEVINALTENKGISCDPRGIFGMGGEGDFVVDGLADHPAVDGVTSMVTNWGSSLEATSPAVGLAFTGEDVFQDLNDNVSHDPGEPTGPFTVAAAYESGAGRLVVVADNPFQDSAFEGRNNAPFVRALLRWLTGQEVSGAGGAYLPVRLRQ
jgi:hypothetical protein